MKYLALLLIFGFGLSGFGQTIKSLGYNTTNGQVVANTGTNVLTFTNNVRITDQVDSTSFTFWGMQGWGAAVSLEERLLRDGETAAFQWGALENTSLVPLNFGDPSSAATTRTNLGLGATWLTNTNAANFRADIGLGSNNSVQFSNVFITNSQAGNSTNYMLSIGAPDTGFTGVGGPAGSVNFRAGGTILWQATSTALEFPTFARVRNTLDFQYGGGALGVISFSGVDPNTGRAISRTNLGLGGGITTNRTFVSYNGTNYTTNTVTISNGIITGWTQ